MRSLLAVAACALALTSSARAQEDNIRIEDFIGVWYGENEVVPPGVRRVVPVRIEISAISTIRVPRRFNVRLVIRCMDRPSEVCDLGTTEVRQIEGNEYQFPVNGWRNVVRYPRSGACGFTMTLQSAWYDGEAFHRVRKNSLEYWVVPGPRPGGRACNPSEYSGIERSAGYVNTAPPLSLTPSVRPEPVRPPLRPPRG
jgi:hypothetical protein